MFHTPSIEPHYRPDAITIAEHWDVDGIITADSSPEDEFMIWSRHASASSADWRGTEFTLADFERHIDGLREGRIS